MRLDSRLNIFFLNSHIHNSGVQIGGKSCTYLIGDIMNDLDIILVMRGDILHESRKCVYHLKG